MLSPKHSYEPICDHIHEYVKPEFITEKIIEICQSISQKGEKSSYSEIFDLLYEHIEDNINHFYPEADYE